MGNGKISQLVEKLIIGTKSRNISWSRLLNFYYYNNNILKNYIIDNERTIYSKRSNAATINQTRSFISQFEQGWLYIFEYNFGTSRKYYVVAIQSNLDSNIIELNTQDEIQSNLMQIVHMIEEQIDNVDDFIDKLIDRL